VALWLSIVNPVRTAGRTKGGASFFVKEPIGKINQGHAQKSGVYAGRGLVGGKGGVADFPPQIRLVGGAEKCGVWLSAGGFRKVTRRTPIQRASAGRGTPEN